MNFAAWRQAAAILMGVEADTLAIDEEYAANLAPYYRHEMDDHGRMAEYIMRPCMTREEVISSRVLTDSGAYASDPDYALPRAVVALMEEAIR